jgi:hypothetical protein
VSLPISKILATRSGSSGRARSVPWHAIKDVQLKTASSESSKSASSDRSPASRSARYRTFRSFPRWSTLSASGNNGGVASDDRPGRPRHRGPPRERASHGRLSRVRDRRLDPQRAGPPRLVPATYGWQAQDRTLTFLSIGVRGSYMVALPRAGLATSGTVPSLSGWLSERSYRFAQVGASRDLPQRLPQSRPRQAPCYPPTAGQRHRRLSKFARARMPTAPGSPRPWAFI